MPDHLSPETTAATPARRPPPSATERSVLVFAIWASLGFLGVAGMIEGFSRDDLAVALLGLAGIVAAFLAHIVVNAVCGRGFTRGETALGIGAFGLFAFVFVAAAVAGTLTRADYHAGVAAFGLLAAGFVAYLATRHGMRGAFSRFHPPGRGPRNGRAEAPSRRPAAGVGRPEGGRR